MAYDETPGAGAVYGLDPDGSTRLVFDGVTISGSIGETPSGAASKSLSAGFRRSW